MIDKCICCESVKLRVYVCTLPKFIFNKSAKIYRCQECHCGATFPSPSAGISFYENNQDYKNIFYEKRELYIQFAKELLSLLDYEEVEDKAKLLDVGCGSGALVECASKIGFDAIGIEANSDVVKVCRKNGLNVINDDIAALNDGDYGKYSVIVLSAILEHLKNPYDLLENVKNHLTEDGILLISQADYMGFLPQNAPWLWYGWQPSEHFWHFSIESFTVLANRAGYEVIKIRKSSLYQSWYFGFNIKELIGKNLANLLSKFANIFGKEDSFDIVLKIKNAP